MKLYIPSLQTYLVFIFGTLNAEEMKQDIETLNKIFKLIKVDMSRNTEYEYDIAFELNIGGKKEQHFAHASLLEDITEKFPDSMVVDIFLEPFDSDWITDIDQWRKLKQAYQDMADLYVNTILKKVEDYRAKSGLKSLLIVLQYGVFHMAGFSNKDEVIQFARKELSIKEKLAPIPPATWIYGRSLFVETTSQKISLKGEKSIPFEKRESYILSSYSPEMEDSLNITHDYISFGHHMSALCTSYAKLLNFANAQSDIEKGLSKVRELSEEVDAINKEFIIEPSNRGFLAGHIETMSNYNYLNEKIMVIYNRLLKMSSLEYAGISDQNTIKKNTDHLMYRLLRLKPSPAAYFPYLYDVWLERFKLISAYYVGTEEEINKIKSKLELIMSKLSLLHQKLQHELSEFTVIIIGVFTIIFGLLPFIHESVGFHNVSGLIPHLSSILSAELVVLFTLLSIFLLKLYSLKNERR